MKIGVISRIIGVPPTGPKPILTYADSVPDEYDSLYMQDVDNPTPVLYSGSVKLGGAHYIYLKFNSDSAGTLYVTGHSDWDLVDPTTYEILLDQSVVDSGTAVNCIRFNGLTSGTWDSITIQVKALQGWYYTMSDALAVPEFTVVGYLLTTFPAAVGYSLSRIEENATKVMRVRRSGDLVETDIGDVFLTGTTDLGLTGDSIDEAALLAWTLAGGGTNHCEILTFYNQQTDGVSGNAIAAAPYPRLISNGVVIEYNSDGATRMGIYGTGATEFSIDDLSLLNNKTYLRIYTHQALASFDNVYTGQMVSFDKGASYRVRVQGAGSGGGAKHQTYSLSYNPDANNYKGLLIANGQLGDDYDGRSAFNLLYYWNPSFGGTGLIETRVYSSNNVTFDWKSRGSTTLPKNNSTASDCDAIKFGTLNNHYALRTFVIYNEDTYYGQNSIIESILLET